MSTQTELHTQPLNVVLRPGSPAEAAYAARFQPHPDLNLVDYGGKTLARLEWTHVYLGDWSATDREHLDAAIPAALQDARLNDVLAQYFPGETVESVFLGAQTGPAPQPQMDKPSVERVVTSLALSSAATLLLPPGVVLADGDVTSEQGLAGYHGSVDGHYYAVAVYSEGANGIVAFDEPWKNVCATVYHELEEVRTDPDVEEAIRTGEDSYLGWYSPQGGEIGDIPISESGGDLGSVMVEVELADGSGSVPVQLMWSNRDSAPASS